MATTNISITEDAYARLASLRKGNESFSDIINRITGKKRLLDYAGILSKESADRIEQHIKESRRRFQKDSRRRLKRIIRELR